MLTGISDDVTVYLSMNAFENPSDYYSLGNMDAGIAKQIEIYLQGANINNFNIKVRISIQLRSIIQQS